MGIGKRTMLDDLFILWRKDLVRLLAQGNVNESEGIQVMQWLEVMSLELDRQRTGSTVTNDLVYLISEEVEPSQAL